MSANSKIEWTDHTFNPWIGCTKVSPACDHCYAEVSTPSRTLGVAWGPKAERRRTSPGNWAMPKRWNAQAEAFQAQHGRRQRVFCASLADVFDNAVPSKWRSDLLDLIDSTPNLDWLLLTKRVGNVVSMLHDVGPRTIQHGAGFEVRTGLPPNVWLGATIANQEEADRDIPKLLAVPAAKRFLSMEPLLGSVELATIHNTDFGEGQPYLHPLIGRVSDGHGDSCGAPAIDWVIVGGESGPKARPMHPDWARSLRDQCQAAGVPFFFKQWGEWAPATEAELPTRYGSPDADSFRCVCSNGFVGRLTLESAFLHKPALWPQCFPHGAEGESSCTTATIRRVGKKAAGRLLDGREWNEVPR